MADKVILYSLLCYLYGAIPYAYVFTYLFTGKNLSKEGTGTIGVTNTFKVGGYRAGTLTVIGELSKGLLPIYCAHRLFPEHTTITLLLVYCSLIGTSFSIFLKGKGGKASTAAMWALLILSWKSLLILLPLWAVILTISRGNILIKKIPLLLIPIVLFSIERDWSFTIFGILTSVLFYLNRYRRKDDFAHYGIFHHKSDVECTGDAHTLHS